MPDYDIFEFIVGEKQNSLMLHYSGAPMNFASVIFDIANAWVGENK